MSLQQMQVSEIGR